MSHPATSLTHRTHGVALIAALCFAMPAVAQDKGAPATCMAAPGILLAQTGDGWKAIKANSPAPAEATLVALFDATLRSTKGGVEVRLAADVGQRGPFPVLETAVMLHDAGKYDLSLSPLRGLVVLNNVKKKGAATVKVGLRDEAVDLTLKEPGAKVALEIYSRHAPGEPQLDPKLDDPVLHIFVIVLSGEALLSHNDKSVTLSAPPGPAILVWDSLVRQPEVQRLEEPLPEIAAMKEKDIKLMEQVNAWSAKLADDDRATILKQGAASKNALERQAAVTAMGALDDLKSVAAVLAASPYADTRDHAVLTLRHWLGRAPGQTVKLDAAMKEAGYTAVQARTVLHLLYGFTPEEKAEPATYDVLLNSLKHSRPAVRQLAHWHLVRLAPDGKSIPFNALAADAELQRSYEQWRELIPAGKLPPRPKETPK